MFLVDSHCHLDSLNYKEIHRDVKDVAQKARSCDVKFILAVCTTLSSFHATKTITDSRDDILFSCGIHPLNVNQSSKLSDLRYLAATKDVIAIGETGLDYFKSCDNKESQHIAFREHIRVAHLLKKPVILHTRGACKDVLAILREERTSVTSGVVHCFSEDKKIAEDFLDIGFYISFSGLVTFKNAKALQEVVRYVPLDRLLIETDSPYLAPVPFRGKENQPAYLRYIAECIAGLKNISMILLSEVTTSNFGDLFHLKMTRYR